ncbi:MAG TPA: Gfo/Idh/MocA family oxidoreductase [Methanomicrobiales archaeon]|nr:Gfo/Idh/MocA family oxidoreductase [Methanomicrobiales archaeon]
MAAGKPGRNEGAIRAAIIGFGGMGQRHHQAYLQNGIEVAAVADWDTEKIRKLLPHLPSRHIYRDDEELLDGEEVDILSVVTNGPTHAGIAIRAAEHGIPMVLCEKPVATSLADARRVIEAAERHGTRLAVNHIRRWSPTYRRLRSLLGEGVIGEIRHLSFSMGSTGIGNFPLHFFDTARFLTGSEPGWAVGFLDSTGTPNPRGKQFIDPGGYGIFGFRNGARFFFDSSEDTGVQYLFEIVGSYGRILIDELNDVWQIRARPEADRTIPFTRYGTGMPLVPYQRDAPHDIVKLTAAAIAELAGGGPVSCTGDDGLRALEMVIALHVSDEQGHAQVSLPLGPEHAAREVRIA